MHKKREIIKMLNSMSGSRSTYDVFSDWVKLMALSIQNSCQIFHDAIWNAREGEYLKTITPYGTDGMKFVEMAGMLAETMETEMSDFLGEIYMESGCGNKNTGQFFTPFHLSYACARLSLCGKDHSKPIAINEPSCGGGGMIIAAAKTLKDCGVNYQCSMKVVAQDLDWKAVYMCYVQLSLLGINAIVIQGNTLTETWNSRPKECIFRTPKNMGIM